MTPSPRVRGEGRGEGLLFSLRKGCNFALVRGPPHPEPAQARIPTSPRKRGEVIRSRGKIKLALMGHLDGVTGRRGAIGAARTESRSIGGIAAFSWVKTEFASSL